MPLFPCDAPHRHEPLFCLVAVLGCTHQAQLYITPKDSLSAWRVTGEQPMDTGPNEVIILDVKNVELKT